MSAENFKSWLKNQQSSEYEIIEKDSRHLVLENPFGQAEINFYDQEIVEFSITAAKDGQNKYWLHFQAVDEEHAKKLGTEMIEAFLTLKNESTRKILLSCSTGMTTGMLAEILNETVQNLGLDYSFQAVGYMDLYQEAVKYDAILLAPQIGYMHKKLAETFKEKPVLLIPTTMFAGNEAFHVLEFIRAEMNSRAAEKEKKQEECKACMQSKSRILTIAFRFEEHCDTRIFYRLHDHGQVVLDEYIKRPKVQHEDIKDILDTVTARYDGIDLVSIALPGQVIPEKRIEFPSGSVQLDRITGWIKENWNLESLIVNNSNAAALGYAKQHPELKNIVYHSQPFGLPNGGQGYIIDGKLHPGRTGLCGEVRFSLSRMQYSDSFRPLATYSEGMLEIVSAALLQAIIVLNPERIAVRSRMTNDMNELKERLLKFLPAIHIPELDYVEDDREILHDGLLALSMEALENKS